MLNRNPLSPSDSRANETDKPGQPVSSSSSPKQEAEYLTPAEAAAHLRVSKSYLDKLRVYGGGPPFHRLGRKILYAKPEIDLFVQRRRFSSTSEYNR